MPDQKSAGNQETIFELLEFLIFQVRAADSGRIAQTAFPAALSGDWRRMCPFDFAQGKSMMSNS
jgi:hypothetical protein